MGLLKIITLAVAIFFIVEAIMLTGFSIFVRPSFTAPAGMVAVFVFLIFEMAFVTFK